MGGVAGSRSAALVPTGYPLHLCLLCRDESFRLSAIAFVCAQLLRPHPARVQPQACRVPLALQGDIADMAQKSPKELTVLFEHISGSEQYRKVGC